MDMLTTTIVYIDAIDYELEDMKNNRPDYYTACDKDCAICGIKLCCHFEGRSCSKDKNWARADENSLHFYSRMPEPEINKDNQLNKTDKNQLLQYFLTYNISEIKEENGELKIKYRGAVAAQK